VQTFKTLPIKHTQTSTWPSRPFANTF